MVQQRDDLVVVDGSNIATEGRSKPSLAQLSDAVMAFMEEQPDITVTVVVDATFGHRIDASEVKDFDAGVANNELVTPPAGAIGRGDAFVLSIANKVGARVLSNDSFQEFHGTYEWLFDEGRLIGGKPVPNVGWVFVERLPVRGAVSRKVTKGGGGTKRTSRRTASTTSVDQERAARATAMAEGRLPPAPRGAKVPVEEPAQPPAERGRGRSRRAQQPPSTPEPDVAAMDEAREPRVPEAVNQLLPFIEFVEHHPLGTSVNAVVESYSSHGAYVTVEDVRGYVPLQLISDPPPRSARKAMAVGDAITLVVASFSPARRSIDLAFPAMAASLDLPEPLPVEAVAEKKPARKRAASTKKVAAKATATTKKASAATTKKAAATATRKAAAKKTTASTAASAASTAGTIATHAGADAAEEPTPTPDTSAAPRASRQTVKKTAAKASTPRKSTAKKSTASTPTATTTKSTRSARTATKKAIAETSPATTSATGTPATKRSTAKRSTSKRGATPRSVATPTSQDGAS